MDEAAVQHHDPGSRRHEAVRLFVPPDRSAGDALLELVSPMLAEAPVVEPSEVSRCELLQGDLAEVETM